MSASLNMYCNTCYLQDVDTKKVFLKIPPPAQPTTEYLIMEKVCEVMHVNQVIWQNRRDRKYAEARFIAVHFIRQYNPGLTLKYLGRLFKRDHSTIVYYCTTFNDMYRFNYDFKKKADAVKEALKTIKRTYQ